MMERVVHLANPSDWPWAMGSARPRLMIVDVGAIGTASVAVWDQSEDAAVETAAEFLQNQGWVGFFVEPDLEDARRDLVRDGVANPSDDQVFETATQDLTYTESGWLPGYELGLTEVPRKSSLFDQILQGSQRNFGITSALVVDPEWQEGDPWPDDLWSRWSLGRIAFSMGRLFRLCVPATSLPLAAYPHWMVERTHVWVVDLLCGQWLDDVRAEAHALVDEVGAVFGIVEHKEPEEVFPDTQEIARLSLMWPDDNHTLMFRIHESLAEDLPGDDVR